MQVALDLFYTKVSQSRRFIVQSSMNPSSSSHRGGILHSYTATSKPEHWQWKDRCWSWSSSTLATWCKQLTRWKRPWCWERLRAGGEGDDRGWDGWMASLTQWTWVWTSSRSWWWTGKPGVLQSMGSKRVGHDWVTELKWSFEFHSKTPKLPEVFFFFFLNKEQHPLPATVNRHTLDYLWLERIAFSHRSSDLPFSVSRYRWVSAIRWACPCHCGGAKIIPWDRSEIQGCCAVHGIARRKRVCFDRLGGPWKDSLSTAFTFASIWWLDYLKVHLLFCFLSLSWQL